MEKIIFYSEIGLGNSMSNRVYHEAYDFCCKYFDAEKIAKHFGEKINKEKVFSLIEELKKLQQEKIKIEKEINEKFKNGEYKVKVNIRVSQQELEDIIKIKKEKNLFLGKGEKIKGGGFQTLKQVFSSYYDDVLINKFYNTSSIKDNEEYILKTVKIIKDKKGKEVKIVEPVEKVEDFLKKFSNVINNCEEKEHENFIEKFLEMIFVKIEVERILYKNGKEINRNKKGLRLKDVYEKYNSILENVDPAIERRTLKQEQTKEITEKITKIENKIKEELKVFYKFDSFLKRNGFYRSKIVGCDNDASVIRLTSSSKKDKDISLEQQLENFVDSLQVKITCNEYKNDNTIILSLGSRWYLKIIPEKCIEYVGKSLQEERNKKQQKEVIAFLKAMIDDIEIEFPSESKEFIKKIEESINKLKNGEDYLNIKEKIIVLIKNIENKELRRYIEDAWLKDIKEELKF